MCQKSPNSASATLAQQIVEALDYRAIDERAARLLLLQTIRPVMTCPSCRRSFTAQEIERLREDKSVRCECGRKSSARSGTVLDGVHAGWREVLLIAVLMHWGCDKRTIAAAANGVSVDSVRRIYDRLAVAA